MAPKYQKENVKPSAASQLSSSGQGSTEPSRSPFTDTTNVSRDATEPAVATSHLDSAQHEPAPKEPPTTMPPSAPSRRLIDTDSEEAMQIWEEARGELPPVESPPDLSLPSNFDRSATMIPFDEDPDINDTVDAFSAEWAPIRKAKGITMCVGVFTAITHTSAPYETRKFFLVDVWEEDIGRAHQLHAELVRMLEKHFPEAEEKFRDLYPLRIRYDENTMYGLSSAPASPSPFPSPTKTTPPEIRAAATRKVGSNVKKVVLVYENKTFLAKQSLLGASVGVYQGLPAHQSGTVGPFVHLRDLNKGGQYVRDPEDGEPAIFFLTSHHVVKSSGRDDFDPPIPAENGRLSVQNATQNPINLATMSQRTHENTYHSRKDRKAAYNEELKHIESTGKPGTDAFVKLDTERQAEARYLHESLRPQIVTQMAADEKYANEHQIGEIPFATVFLASGREVVDIDKQLLQTFKAASKSQTHKLLNDYGIGRVKRDFYGLCRNEFLEHRFPHEYYPQSFNKMRVEKRIKKIGVLSGKQQVMKVGETSGISFGAVQESTLHTHIMKNGDESRECWVQRVDGGSLFAYHGDSGGAVVNNEGELVGIVTAGGSGRDAMATFITPIQHILADLKQNFGLEVELCTRTSSPYVEDSQKALATSKGNAARNPPEGSAKLVLRITSTRATGDVWYEVHAADVPETDREEWEEKMQFYHGEWFLQSQLNQEWEAAIKKCEERQAEVISKMKVSELVLRSKAKE